MKRFSLLLCLVLPVASYAQTPDAPAGAPVISAVNAFFALSVANIDESTRWYRDKLGLRVIMQAPRTDATKSAATVLQGGGLTVELVQHDEAERPDQPANAIIQDNAGNYIQIFGKPD